MCIRDRCLTGLDGRALARLETTSKRVQQLADDGCWRAAVDAAGVHDARADATQVECKAMLHEVENWARGRFLFDVTDNIVGVRASRMPSLAAPTSSSARGDPNPMLPGVGRPFRGQVLHVQSCAGGERNASRHGD